MDFVIPTMAVRQAIENIAKENGLRLKDIIAYGRILTIIFLS
jgi:hypothetical protein